MDEGYSQGCCHKSYEVSNDPTPEGKNDGIPRALVQQQEVLDLRLALPALRTLPRGDHIGEEPCIPLGLVELGLERVEMEVADVHVRYEHVDDGSVSVTVLTMYGTTWPSNSYNPE